MVKEPQPGRVKTRLGGEIGSVAAAWWFRRHALARIRRLRDPRWRLVLAVSPDAAGMRSRVWPADLDRWPQGHGDLGTRMRSVFALQPSAKVCIIGADIPGITRAHIARAFAALGRSDAVIGPAEDGGYWLVGLKRGAAAPAGLFEGVRWSSSHALEDTLVTMTGLRIATIDTLSDVDTTTDLARLPPHLRAW